MLITIIILFLSRKLRRKIGIVKVLKLRLGLRDGLRIGLWLGFLLAGFLGSGPRSALRSRSFGFLWRLVMLVVFVLKWLRLDLRSGSLFGLGGGLDGWLILDVLLLLDTLLLLGLGGGLNWWLVLDLFLLLDALLLLRGSLLRFGFLLGRLLVGSLLIVIDGLLATTLGGCLLGRGIILRVTTLNSLE